MIEDEDGNEMVLAYLNKAVFWEWACSTNSHPQRLVRTGSSRNSPNDYPAFGKSPPRARIDLRVGHAAATRLDRTNRKLGDLAFVDVTGRVAHAIMDLWASRMR